MYFEWMNAQKVIVIVENTLLGCIFCKFQFYKVRDVNPHASW